MAKDEKKQETTPAKPDSRTEPATQRPERSQTQSVDNPPAPATQHQPSISMTPVAPVQQPSVTQVTVTSNIPKAMVVVDGQDVGWAPWSGQLAPGMHTFAVKANNKAKLKTQDFNVRVQGRTTTVPINVPDPSVFK